MPQPKSRKIAILGYRSVGEYRTRLNAGKKKKKKSRTGEARWEMNVRGLWAQLTWRRLRLPLIIGCDDWEWELIVRAPPGETRPRWVIIYLFIYFLIPRMFPRCVFVHQPACFLCGTTLLLLLRGCAGRPFSPRRV